MPRYLYFCNDCQEDFIVFHSISDKQKECNICQSENIKKMLTKPTYLTKKSEQKKSVGNLTKKYIEDNKEILKDLKKEVQKDYDRT